MQSFHPSITQLGQPVLRQRAKAIPAKKIPHIGGLIQSMMKTMRKAQGVGIAAPQVGKSVRLFIVAPEPSVRYPHAPRIPPIVMINPELVSHSKTTNTGYEGCLSIPGIRGEVPRYNQVRIRFLTPDGIRRQAILKGFVARIIQHEVDHINGGVFLDRVADTRSLITEQEYRKLFKQR